MESERHRAQMDLLIEALKLFWHDRDDVYVAGNMAIYFSELQAKKNDFRGTDVFVVLDTNRRERKSWVVWQEDGRTPDVVIELLSESTEAVDRGEKMRVYAKLLHVSEYYLFDPFSGALEAYTLDQATRSYVLRTGAARGERRRHERVPRPAARDTPRHLPRPRGRLAALDRCPGALATDR